MTTIRRRIRRTRLYRWARRTDRLHRYPQGWLA